MRLSLYKAVMYSIEKGYINAKKLKFNYDKKSITYDGKIVVSDGVCVSEYFLGIPVDEGLAFDVGFSGTFIETLEKLYGDYYLSERTHTRGINFVAKKSDCNSDILKFLDGSGEYHRVKLEVFLFCVIVSRLYSWEFSCHWFWRSVKYPKLYLYRRWFE